MDLTYLACEFSEPLEKQVFSQRGSQSPEAPENSVIRLV